MNLLRGRVSDGVIKIAEVLMKMNPCTGADGEHFRTPGVGSGSGHKKAFVAIKKMSQDVINRDDSWKSLKLGGGRQL